MIDCVFLFCGVYGVALALLIASWHVTPAAIRLFVADDYTLGSHGQVWANWHSAGCLFVGVVNLTVYCGDFNPGAARGIAIATTMIYGIWFAQNLMLMINRRALFKAPMWLNVVCCGAAAGLAAWAVVVIA